MCVIFITSRPLQLFLITITAAHANSPATSNALLTELRQSQPHDLANITFYVPNAFGKAYRFVAEMNEMASFVRDKVDKRSREGQYGDASTTDVGTIYDGFAHLYRRIADSAKDVDDGLDITILRTFSDEAKRRLDRQE